MKKILITGQNSYIGNQFEKWVSQWPNDYQITKISVRNDDWKNLKWSDYDSIVHVAGIAHNSSDPSLEQLYFSVNRDLSFEIARKAKNEGVNQFVYLSSIIVYGTKNSKITENSIPEPDNFYGQSKLEAEELIKNLDSPGFSVAIIRPPMVYGKNAKGNFPILVNLAKKTPIFPRYSNKRSMIYIKNLTEFIRLIVSKNSRGIYYPQNNKYVSTDNLIKTIAKLNKHSIFFVPGMSQIINAVNNKGIFNKVFGDLYYDMSMSNYEEMQYQIFDLSDSIKDIEAGDCNYEG